MLQIVHGGKLLQHAELNCNSLENFHGYTLVLYNHAKLIAQAISLGKFHRERFALYSTLLLYSVHRTKIS